MLRRKKLQEEAEDQLLHLKAEAVVAEAPAVEEKVEEAKADTTEEKLKNNIHSDINRKPSGFRMVFFYASSE